MLCIVTMYRRLCLYFQRGRASERAFRAGVSEREIIPPLPPLFPIPQFSILINEHLNHRLRHGFYLLFAKAEQKKLNLLKQPVKNPSEEALSS